MTEPLAEALASLLRARDDNTSTRRYSAMANAFLSRYGDSLLARIDPPSLDVSIRIRDLERFNLLWWEVQWVLHDMNEGPLRDRLRRAIYRFRDGGDDESAPVLNCCGGPDGHFPDCETLR